MILEHSGVNDIFQALGEREHRAMPWWWRCATKSFLIQLVANPVLGDRARVLEEPDDDEMRELLRQTSMQNLRRMNQVAREHGVEMKCLTFARPNLDRLSSSDVRRYDWNVQTSWRSGGSFLSYCRFVDLYNEELVRLADNEAMDLIPLDSHLSGGFFMFSDICHNTPDGIDKKAQVVAEYLRDDLKTRLAAD